LVAFFNDLFAGFRSPCLCFLTVFLARDFLETAFLAVFLAVGFVVFFVFLATGFFNVFGVFAFVVFFGFTGIDPAPQFEAFYVRI
jgi:hypothetical protein